MGSGYISLLNNSGSSGSTVLFSPVRGGESAGTVARSSSNPFHSGSESAGTVALLFPTFAGFSGGSSSSSSSGCSFSAIA